MLKLNDRYSVDHYNLGRKLIVYIKDMNLQESEELAVYKNTAYSDSDVAFLSIHAIVKATLAPYFKKYNTKNSENDTYYSIIYRNENNYTCLIKQFNDDKAARNGALRICYDNNIPRGNIEYRYLGRLKNVDKIKDFIDAPIYMRQGQVSYKSIDLLLLKEEGKLYG